MEEIRYLDLINQIVKYLNDNNPDSNYAFTELYYWYDIVCPEGGEIPGAGRDIFGVILKPQSVGHEIYDYLYSINSKKSREEAIKYFLDNNITYCYQTDDTNSNILSFSVNKFYRYLKSRTHIKRNFMINLDEAKSHFKCIDEELLNNVISSIRDNNSQMILKRK